MNTLGSFGGSAYQVNGPMGNILNGLGGLNNQRNIDFALKRGYISPFAMQQSGQSQVQAPSSMPTSGNFQAYLNGLSTDASNALNGGLLGYMPSRFISPGSNPQVVDAPQGSFRFPFGMLRGY